MKKFCLLAIASCFATLGFSQNAASKAVRPASKNTGTTTTAVASTATPQLTTADNQSAKPAVATSPKANIRLTSKKTHAKS